MKTKKHKLLVILAAVIIGTSTFSSRVLSQQQPRKWFAHRQGSVQISAFVHGEEEEQLLLEGLLKFNYPHDFSIDYEIPRGTVSITSHAGFLEVQTNGEFQYGYDEHWIFSYLQAYLFELIGLTAEDLEFSGTDQIAELDAFRYLDQTNSERLYWFEQFTGLPVLIMAAEKPIVSVQHYAFDLDTGQLVAQLWLDFDPYPAVLTLVHEPKGWAPLELVVQEPGLKVAVHFSHWNFQAEWLDASAVPLLTELKALNDRFLEEFQAESWSAALQTCEAIRQAAPQFWQVYLYQAFVYEGMQNYLGVVENYQQVLMREPYNALALNNLAYHYLLREIQISQAIEMAELAVALERKSAYLDTLGYGYYLTGRYLEAEELLIEALADAPKEAVEEIEAHLALVIQALEKED